MSFYEVDTMEEERAIFSAIAVLQLRRLDKMVTELRQTTIKLDWEEHMLLTSCSTGSIVLVIQ